MTLKELIDYCEEHDLPEIGSLANAQVRSGRDISEFVNMDVPEITRSLYNPHLPGPSTTLVNGKPVVCDGDFGIISTPPKDGDTIEVQFADKKYTYVHRDSFSEGITTRSSLVK